MPTGRLIVGRDTPAQGKQSEFINLSGCQSGRPDLGLVCLRLLELEVAISLFEPFILAPSI